MSVTKHIGIVGGGPSGLFMLKRLVESGDTHLAITIFEKTGTPGAGMPYSQQGASYEHITNVSGNEIPDLLTGLVDWIKKQPQSTLAPFGIDSATFHDYKVVPRLLFGQYLANQFQQFLKVATTNGIAAKLLCNTAVKDVVYHPHNQQVTIVTAVGEKHVFDSVIICTGHHWPAVHEGETDNWFDSPYPPGKLAKKANYPVAIKGASLSAIDAVRTLARHNGHFAEVENGMPVFTRNSDSPNFTMVMHSLHGLLPAIRFHLEDSHLAKDTLLSNTELQQVMDDNDGFVPLDYIYEKNFLEPLQQQAPAFYQKIKHLAMEQFVEAMMEQREKRDAFELFMAEYLEAEKSIDRQQSVHWKEMLAVLSYAMNYPAKHFSAEDMLRLKKTLMPLISLVIAFVPQSSCREMIALHRAGALSIVAVTSNSEATPSNEGGAVYRYTTEDGEDKTLNYPMFVNAIGQQAFTIDDFPFESLRIDGVVSRALVKFRQASNGESEKAYGNINIEKDEAANYYLRVPGIQINDHFQVLDKYGAANQRLFLMAVPYMSGLNPDYSGLDFCEEASRRIALAIDKTSNPRKENASFYETPGSEDGAQLSTLSNR